MPSSYKPLSMVFDEDFGSVKRFKTVLNIYLIRDFVRSQELSFSHCN